MTASGAGQVDWHLNFQDDEYLKLSLDRLRDDHPPLDWCLQFAEMIGSRPIQVGQPWELNDVGCNVGHFCKALSRLATPPVYRGYDISETYLQIARKRYPQHSFHFLDIAADAPEQDADVSIVSATLEHIEAWESALKHILQSSRQAVVLRSFFGEVELSDHYKKADAGLPYLIRQFTFRQMAETALSLNFKTRFLRDRATDSIAQYLGCGITRTQYVAYMTKSGA